jgi:DNA repair protein RadC
MQQESVIDENVRSGGLGRLGDSELLYLVLRLGGSGENIWNQACLLSRGGRSFFREARRCNWQHLMDSGLTFQQSAALFAAFELARRSNYKLLPLSNPFRSSKQIFEYFKPLTADLKKECFWSVLLDGRNRVIRVVRISEGSLTSSLVHPREVFRPAILEAAASMIFVHNHPTGEPDPSPEDISITRRLVEVGKVMGIAVLDHVIMGTCFHFSFADEGLLTGPSGPFPGKS